MFLNLFCLFFGGKGWCCTQTNLPACWCFKTVWAIHLDSWGPRSLQSCCWGNTAGVWGREGLETHTTETCRCETVELSSRSWCRWKWRQRLQRVQGDRTGRRKGMKSLSGIRTYGSTSPTLARWSPCQIQALASLRSTKGNEGANSEAVR